MDGQPETATIAAARTARQSARLTRQQRLSDFVGNATQQHGDLTVRASPGATEAPLTAQLEDLTTQLQQQQDPSNTPATPATPREQEMATAFEAFRATAVSEVTQRTEAQRILAAQLQQSADALRKAEQVIRDWEQRSQRARDRSAAPTAANSQASSQPPSVTTVPRYTSYTGAGSTPQPGQSYSKNVSNLSNVPDAPADPNEMPAYKQNLLMFADGSGGMCGNRIAPRDDRYGGARLDIDPSAEARAFLVLKSSCEKRETMWSEVRLDDEGTPHSTAASLFDQMLAWIQLQRGETLDQVEARFAQLSMPSQGTRTQQMNRLRKIVVDFKVAYARLGERKADAYYCVKVRAVVKKVHPTLIDPALRAMRTLPALFQELSMRATEEDCEDPVTAAAMLSDTAGSDMTFAFKNGQAQSPRGGNSKAKYQCDTHGPNHSHDTRDCRGGKKKSTYKGGRGGDGNSKGRECWNCGETGHISAKCPKPSKSTGTSKDDANKPNWKKRHDKKDKAMVALQAEYDQYKVDHQSPDFDMATGE